ncbi:hypothetical protein T4A_8684 [Trichinella pseudospiralis]|uniref:Uncharacterized protein n=1 Tax=Trichinella pseudospiralis TaxID=6337 RepID=A0A0V1EJJ6_TRIPS|nr:hypothetical protein T4A_8684 [Trichinella pseudospiralis]
MSVCLIGNGSNPSCHHRCRFVQSKTDTNGKTDKKKANFRPDVSTTTTTTTTAINRTIIIIILGDVVSIVSMIQQFNNKPTNLLACQKITNTNKA